MSLRTPRWLALVVAVVLNAAANRDPAEAFVGSLRSPAGRRALTQVGLDIP